MFDDIQATFNVPEDQFTMDTLRMDLGKAYEAFSETAHPIGRLAIHLEAFTGKRKFVIYSAAKCLKWPLAASSM